MVEAIFEIHDPPECKEGQHNPGCTPTQGYSEICKLIPEEGICVCVHWPPIKAGEDLAKRQVKIVDKRGKRA